MAYYLLRKHGQHLATHLAVGRGKYLLTSCGIRYTRQLRNQPHKTRIEREHLAGGDGTNQRSVIITPLRVLGVTCAHCLRLPIPPNHARIPPAEQSTKPGARRTTPRALP